MQQQPLVNDFGLGLSLAVGKFLEFLFPFVFHPQFLTKTSVMNLEFNFYMPYSLLVLSLLYFFVISVQFSTSVDFLSPFV